MLQGVMYLGAKWNNNEGVGFWLGVRFVPKLIAEYAFVHVNMVPGHSMVRLR